MGLKILTWNISYGHGAGSDGSGSWRRHDPVHYEQALSAMATLMRNTGTDIALLQEVDFASSRSHFQNQLDQLARKSGLLHRSNCISWDHPYVPYPGWNPIGHFGRVRSGGGILSRFPIHSICTDLLPKPKENSALVNSFYLNRYFQIVETAGLRLLNLHLEAFSEENRSLHLLRLGERIREYAPDIIGGDFNGSIAISENHQQEFLTLPAPRPTFPSHSPTKIFDGFILKNSRIRVNSIDVPDTGGFSDHLPVLLDLETRDSPRSSSPQT